MGRQYTAVELIRLRESPLVCKPPGLPPPEEWMGAPLESQPQREQNQRTKRVTNKIDDSPFATEPSGRRQSLFDGTRILSRTSIPDDIVLGPPKTSFASATAVRNFNKLLDSTDKPSSSTFDDDSSKPDTYSVREKFFKERERTDRDQADGKTRDFRSSNLSTRRGIREDGDEWTSVKPRRSFGQEDGERFVRRNGDRDNGKENAKDRSSRPFDSYTRDKDRDREKDDVPRRNIPGRGRNEPTWFNSNESSNPLREADGSKDSIRDRGWRDKTRGGDSRDAGGDSREWTREVKRESRPEWMDTANVDDNKAHEKKPSHTMEEFQRWKERMKAGGVSTPTEEKKKSPVEEKSVQDQPLLTLPQKTEPVVQKYDSVLILETQEDKFFGLWNEPKRPADEPSSDTNHQVPPKKESTRPTVGKSRFQSFFSPQEEIQGRGSKTDATPQHNSPPPPIMKDTSNEDKEGFQRILQMLGGASLDSAPSSQQQFSVMPPKISTHDRSQSSTSVSSPIQATPPGPGLGFNGMGPDQSFPPRNRNATGPAGLQNILGPQISQSGPQGNQPQSRPQNQPPNRDSEFLFRLMQQSRSQPHLPTLSGQPLLGNTQGMPPLPQLSGGPLDMPRGKLHQGMPQLGMFDDPSITGYQRPPLPHHNQGPLRDLNAPSRPPGLEQVPVNWPGNLLGAPQSHHRQIAPPPGLNAQRPQFAPFLPPPPGLPFQMPGMVPPNLPPPPGFFGMNGMNGPPGGYPHMPFQPDGFMGMPGPGGHVGGGGVPGGPQVPYAPYPEGINGANGRGAPPGQYHNEARRNRQRYI